MATVFFSHASVDDRLADQIDSWLIAAGFTDIFLDHSKIRGGDKWSMEIQRASVTCKIVICLVTSGWLASDECNGEFVASRLLGKRIIPLLALASPLTPEASARLRNVQREDQGFDITSAIFDGTFHPASLNNAKSILAGLRASGALVKVGLDPEAFEIDPLKIPSPFPGLESFNDTDGDAALFYGRSDDTTLCLEELRQMRATADPRSLAIVGSSGSGKSSLLKAGMLPRLRREEGWIALRSFRPGVDGLVSFSEAWSRTFNEFGVFKASSEISSNIEAAWSSSSALGDASENRLVGLRAVLDDLAGSLRHVFGKPEATILVSLDQAEELLDSDQLSADIVCDCLRAMTINLENKFDAYSWATALTIRADKFADLQRNARFLGLAVRAVDIRPVESYRVDDIVERPAARYGVKVAPQLLSLLIKDSSGDDALPLLAFALRQLWEALGEGRELEATAYEKLHGIGGLIELAAERALRGIRPDQKDARQLTTDREKLARDVFVPGLMSINDKGAPTKLVMQVKWLSDPAAALLEDFIAWRLIVRKRVPEPIGTTVELAHDAVLRSWPRLAGWLTPEVHRLEAVRLLDQSALLWDRRGRSPEFLVHAAHTLHEATVIASEPRFSPQITDVQRQYLAAATKKQRSHRLGLLAAISTTLFVIFCVAAALTSINQSRGLERAATLYMKLGQPLRALRLAIAAVPERSQITRLFAPTIANDTLRSTGFQLPIIFQAEELYQLKETTKSNDSRFFMYQTLDWAGRVVDASSGRVVREVSDGDFQGGDFSSDSKFAVTRTGTNHLEAVDLQTGRVFASDVEVTGASRSRYGYDPMPKTAKFLVARQGKDVSLWDLSTNTIVDLGLPTKELEKWVKGAESSRFVLVSRDLKCEIWDASTAQPTVRLPDCNLVLMSPDGQVVVTQSQVSIHFWNGRTNEVKTPPKFLIRPSLVGLSKNGKYLGITYPDGRGEIWSTATGEKTNAFCGSATDTFYFSPDETRVLALNNDHSAALCDVETDTSSIKAFPSGGVAAHAFSKDGRALLVITNDNHAFVVDIRRGDVITDFNGEPVDNAYFTPDGRQIFTTYSATGTESLWNLESHKKLDLSSDGGISDIFFSEDGSRAVINGADSRAVVWDLRRNEKIADIGAAVQDLVFFTDGSRLLVSPSGQNANAILLGLPERRLPDLQGSDLRANICSTNRGHIGLFSDAEVKEIDKVVGATATAAIEGLPWNPCDWRGLSDLEGWAQLGRRRAIRWLGIMKYRCGEVAAFGRMDKDAALACAKRE
ncbi:toll/interleukin-1 receptor domain-containing protein [Rhizobium leguminosarum]|uniref:toll/interleukin-1 receptor domain-containing protein n=1 Tax=Rhizobium leguminosarum TaxID=384 RepID=UPI003ECEC764